MSDDELTYVRVVAAEPSEVFACMTEPEHLAAFWGPEGTTTPLDGIVVDPRAGGRFETVIVSDRDGSRHHMRAVFDEVREPDLLAWTEPATGMSVVVTLREAGPGRTEMRIRQRHVPDAMRTPENRQGFESSLDRLQRHLLGTRREDT